jgi:serine/threonine-protein kinase
MSFAETLCYHPFFFGGSWAVKICAKCRTEFPDEIAHCLSDGAKLLQLGDKSRDPKIGTFAQDRFVLLDLKDSGGMSGGVYLAHQVGMDRDVALKVLSKRDLADGEFVERFEREAKIIGNLRSRNTVTCHDFGRLDSGELYIAMEWVDGRTLETILREEGPLPPERVTSIVDQICESLEEAHRQGLVHRDLKPSNVMIRDDGTVKLLDFGLAKKVANDAEPDESISRAGHFYGSYPYAAPELWAPEEYGDPGPETDIYALGIIIYELLAGTRPFVASGQINWAQRHLYERPALLSSAVPFPDEFRPIVEKCLEKRKEDRYRSVTNLREDVLDASWMKRPEVPRPRFGLLAELTRGVTLMFLAFAMFVVSLGLVAVSELGADQPSFRMAPAALDVDSDPRGAAIVIDGEPTGLTTPALIETLIQDRTVEISVEKDGEIARQSVRLQSGKRERVMIVLGERAE